MVLMISIIPAFALNETNTTNETQDTTQNSTTVTQNQSTSVTGEKCHINCKNNQNCSNCDGDQHKYQYGQKNGNAGANKGNCDEQHKYQYGLKNNARNNCTAS